MNKSINNKWEIICESKNSYSSEEAALIQIKFSEKEGLLEPYLCRCGKWHNCTINNSKKQNNIREYRYIKKNLATKGPKKMKLYPPTKKRKR